MKQSHASSTSIRQLSDCLSINIIKKSLLRFKCYSEFCNTLQKIHGKLQHVKNANITVECEECGMWRLVYATKKLTKAQQKTLMSALDGMSFSCGSSLQDLEMDHELKDTVFVRNMNCCDPIEILYYTAENEPICIHCGQLEPFSNDISYPQCDSCKDKPAISKK